MLTVRRMVIFLFAASSTVLCAQQTPQFRAGSVAPVLDPPPPTPSTTTSSSAGFTGTEGLTTIPSPYAFQPEPSPLAPSQLFRNTQFPYGPVINPEPLGPNINSDSLNASAKLNLSAFAGVPFLTQSAFEPQDADLKIGPFYFKLRELQAAFLYSDNINLTHNPEAGEIAYVGMTIQVMAQITDNLRVATEGTFVYLPIQNQAGIAGFGLGEFYNFGLMNGPLVHAQVAWDTEIAGWHVVFADDFEVGVGFLANDFRSNDALFTGFNTNAEAITGRYELRPNEEFFFPNNNQNDLNNRNDVVLYTNIVSATADRLLPDSIRLSVRLYHENFWYNQGNRGLPELRQDGAIVGLFSERENLRFKPYFIYEAIDTDEMSGVQSIFRAGIHGPITDQLQLLAEIGYFVGGIQGNNGSGLLWDIQLNHVAGPYTEESLIWTRDFNFFHDEIDDVVGFNVTQILGPKLRADGYVYRVLEEISFQDGTQLNDDQWRIGVRLDYNLGPKTWLQLTGQYATANQPAGISWWQGRAELDYNFTDTLRLQLIYQYTQSQSQLIGNDYRENLFFISLTKYFE